MVPILFLTEGQLFQVTLAYRLFKIIYFGSEPHPYRGAALLGHPRAAIEINNLQFKIKCCAIRKRDF
jgi:hypothetical protein